MNLNWRDWDSMSFKTTLVDTMVIDWCSDGNIIYTHRKIAPRKILISLPNLTDTRTHNFLTSRDW